MEAVGCDAAVRGAAAEPAGSILVAALGLAVTMKCCETCWRALRGPCDRSAAGADVSSAAVLLLRGELEASLPVSSTAPRQHSVAASMT